MSAGMRSAFRQLKDAGDGAGRYMEDKLDGVTANLFDLFGDFIKKVRGGDKIDGLPELPSTPHRPYNPVRGDDGNYVPGSLPSKAELGVLTRTEPDSAFYWSGRDANGVGVGPNGSGTAENIASGSGGQTLEQTLAANGVNPLPDWDETDPEATRFWEEASGAFAENASGDVRAVVGSDLRPGNVWQTIEIPRLQDNPNVSNISQLDPDTGIWTSL